MDEKAKRAEFDDILAALKLTPDDIAANRDGKFTPGNLKKLEEADIDKGCALMAIPVLMAVFTVVLVTVIIPRGDSLRSAEYYALFAGLPLIFLIIFWRGRHALKRDRTEQRVQVVTGSLTTLYGRRSCYLHVANIQDTISQAAYELLKTREGEPFTVYYAPHSKTLLSLEPARKLKEADD